MQFGMWSRFVNKTCIKRIHTCTQISLYINMSPYIMHDCTPYTAKYGCVHKCRKKTRLHGYPHCMYIRVRINVGNVRKMHVVKAFHINCMVLWWYERMSERVCACATWMHAKWNWKWNVYESMGLFALSVAFASAVVVFISLLLFSFHFIFFLARCYCFLFSSGIACFCGYLLRSPKKWMYVCVCACTFQHMLIMGVLIHTAWHVANTK